VARRRAARLIACSHIENCCKHPLGIGQNFVIPETQHPETLRFQIVVANAIASAFRMVRTIGLNNEPMFEADEISNIVVDGNLPPELEPRKPFSPQQIP
jgi:hypothetical protein